MTGDEFSLSSDEDWEESNSLRLSPPRRRESMLEIIMETLMGTTFDLRLSSKTTISQIKSRLQGSEGVAKQHLHILYKGIELEDDMTLDDYGIKTGSSLKVVLSMRGGPINTRRVVLPATKPPNAHLHNLVMKKKSQILERIPKNGQVTVVLFRDGDKVNLYQVEEKSAGGHPIQANDPGWSGRSSSLQNLLSYEPNSTLDDNRLKENAATMNKMMELRSQLESLSMAKKQKRKQTSGLKTKRVFSGSTAKSGSTKTKKSISLGFFGSSGTNSDLGFVKHYVNKDLSGSLAGTAPLPPISSTVESKSDRKSDGNEFCTILPLELRTGRNRRESYDSAFPSLSNVDPVNFGTQRTSKPKKTFKRVLHGRQKTDNNDSLHHWMASTEESLVDPQKNSQDYFDDQGSFDEEFENFDSTENERQTNIDLFDLQYQANDDDSLRIVGYRPTKKLISADISSIIEEGNHPVKGRHMSGRVDTSSSQSKRYIDRMSPPRTLSADSVGPVATIPEGTFPPPTSSSRTSSSKKKNPTSGRSSRRTLSSRSQSSGKRPTFIASTLNSVGGMVQTRKKKNRCCQYQCKKKLKLTSTFTCRCNLSFCTIHRHPELHDCTFDYKTEGRRMLEEANPVVKVPKLPKI